MKTTFTTTRLEAFSDGVLAIVITIMVLELKVPHGPDSLSALRPLWPVFLSYALSFVYVGIYWNNHHHLLHAAREISGGVLWANLHLLFWLSIIPFVTAWMGENHFAPVATSLYGVVLLINAIAYAILQACIRRLPANTDPLGRALGRDLKGRLSPLAYVAAIPLAFVHVGIACGLYVLVAAIWLIPDPRMEQVMEENPETQQ